jgi:hypothetical protein
MAAQLQTVIPKLLTLKSVQLADKMPFVKTQTAFSKELKASNLTL